MQVIGQKNLINVINTSIENNALPKFIIISGEVGSGRKTIAKYISNKLNCEYVEFGNKIDDIRQLIDICYTQTRPTIYCIKDAQDMSINAKNSLLKIAEEPPKYATIIMTTTGENTLATIRSRGIEFAIEPYSREDLYEYIKTINVENSDIISSCADNIGDCIELSKLNVTEIVDLAKKLINNIGNASIGNVLKVTNSLALKDDQQGISVKYFLKILKNVIYESYINSDRNSLYCHKCLYGIIEVTTAIREINSKFNSKGVIDNLLISLKEIYS